MKSQGMARLAPLAERDLPFVCSLYNYYTEHTTAVYFTDPVPPEEIRAIVPVGDPLYRSFRIEREGEEEPVGFCFFSRFKEKPAFAISVEVTIYLRPDCIGEGVGSEALQQMEPFIWEAGFTNAVALIDAENGKSISLFERCGYRRCAEIRHVAEKFGRKLTLLMYQKLMESK